VPPFNAFSALKSRKTLAIYLTTVGLVALACYLSPSTDLGALSLRPLAEAGVEIVKRTGYMGLFLSMTLESALTPIPSEVVVPLAGYLSSEGIFDPGGVIAVTSLANLAGSALAYYAGLKGGRTIVVRYGKYLLISEREVEWAEKFFKRYGSIAVLIGRLLPAVRTVISLPAGVAKMNFLKFSTYTLIGSLMWNTMLTFGGMRLGERWDEVARFLDRLIPLLLYIVFSLLLLYLFTKFQRQS